METAVEIRDLTVTRGGRTVLAGVDASIPLGEITGLLGPSGSGKTTLMRAIVGVQVIESGTITVLGERAGSTALRGVVGYVTQSPSVYSDLSVSENVAYFASLYGRVASEVDETITTVGLADHADQLVATLSGGQLSRASLACALVSRPRLLVLDEPTVGQDPVLRDELWSRFRALVDVGTTIIVSSHVMDEANRCDTLILLRDGEVIARDTPDRVKVRAGTTDLDEAFLRIIKEKEASR